MSVHVVLPVRDQCSLTMSICEQLRDQAGWERCWVLDNGSTDGTPEYLARLAVEDHRFQPLHAAGEGIYEMWAHGLARAHGVEHVAFLNNDLRLASNTIEALSEALWLSGAWISYPDYDRTVDDGVGTLSTEATLGTYRHGGMSGFAFMLAADKIDWEPLVDPQFGWWCGDDDLAFEVEKRGGTQVRVVGLGIDHLGEGTARHHPELHARKEADLARCMAKWGR